MHRTLIGLVFSVSITAALPAAAAEYTITTVNPASGFSGVQLFGVNDAGQAVGTFISTTVGVTQPFIYSGGSFTSITGPASALASSAFGISNTGVIVGSFYETTVIDPGTGNTVPGPTKGFILDGGVFTIVDQGTGAFTQMRGVSPDGRWASGYYLAASGQNLGFVLDRSSGSIIDVTAPGSQFTIPQGINGNGVVAGSDFFPGPSPSRPGFTYDLVNNVRTSYDFAGYARTAVRDVSNAGVLAGWLQQSPAAGGAVVGFVGTPGSFETLSVNGSNNTTIQSMNENGWLVGNYTLADGTPLGFIAAPVPEPAALLMWACGGLVLLVMARRRAAVRS